MLWLFHLGCVYVSGRTKSYAECPASDLTSALRTINECILDINRWLKCNHLLLNATKTEAILFPSTAVCSLSVVSTTDMCESVTQLTPPVRDASVKLDSTPYIYFYFYHYVVNQPRFCRQLCYARCEGVRKGINYKVRWKLERGATKTKKHDTAAPLKT